MVTGGGEWCQAPLKQTKATLSSKGWSGIGSSEFLKNEDQQKLNPKREMEQMPEWVTDT